MAMGTAALGLLAFLLGCSGTSAEPQNSERFALRKCDLTGNWKNDLSSTMRIGKIREKGEFSGTYQTAVSGSGKPIQPSPLQGIQRQGNQPVFGFTVHWDFADSSQKTIAVFAGQCLLNADGKEHLKTTWLLREEVPSMKSDWGATKVGTDTFYRTI